MDTRTVDTRTMGICAEELRLLVVRPMLTQLGDWSEAAENLLLGTAAQESRLGRHLKFGRCERLGIYQITPTAHTAIWDSYLIDNPALASQVRGFASQHAFLADPNAELTTNLNYATAIAWMIYRRSLGGLPATNDLAALAHLWQQYYRTDTKGPAPCPAAADVGNFIQTYRALILSNCDHQAA